MPNRYLLGDAVWSASTVRQNRAWNRDHLSTREGTADLRQRLRIALDTERGDDHCTVDQVQVQVAAGDHLAGDLHVREHRQLQRIDPFRTQPRTVLLAALEVGIIR